MSAMNIEEIARLAGVSRSTVSRVINNSPSVRPSTREHVLQIIQQANYQPNAAARSLASGRSRILGLVIPMGVGTLFTDPYFPQLIQGVAAACVAHNYSVMLWLDDPDHERHAVRQLNQGGLIAGVIIASMLLDDPLVQAVTESGLPFMLVGRHPTNGAASYADVDNVEGARGAVMHLLRLGYQRVAHIAGPHNMIAGVDRREGYMAAVRGRGLAPDPALIVEGDFTEDGGYLAMQRLLPQQPEAVFVASDTMALGAMRALREAGQRVPDDIAIVGFDDMPFAARTDPPLTTVRQPIHQTGYVAAENLIDVIDNPTSGPRRILLPVSLVIRASCGAMVSVRMPEG